MKGLNLHLKLLQPGALPYISLLSIIILLFNCDTKSSAEKPDPKNQKWWLNRHLKFNNLAQKGNINLIFIGDSITHGWEKSGKKIWEKYLTG